MSTSADRQPRPRRDPERTRRRILAAALEEFAAKGFAGARVAGIAGRARVNKRMLYAYFGSKQDLFLEVLRRKLFEHADVLADSPETLEELLPFWADTAQHDPKWVRLLKWEALGQDASRPLGEGERRAQYAAVTERLRGLQDDGRLDRDLDPGQALLGLIALSTFPHAFPQLARLMTGLEVGDARFRGAHHAFLRQVAVHLQGAHSDARRADSSVRAG
jgi:AcrR family transcriptional regulator